MADRQRLEKLLAYHTDAVKSLTFALALMNGDERETKAATVNGTVAAAVRVERQRKAAAPAKPRRPRNPHYGADIKKQRTKSARILASLSPDEPRPLKAAQTAAGGLTRHGYIKSAGRAPNGTPLFLRTAKDFTI